jgi:pimeloyl-ACP methyl ester carboxylesterase
VQWDEGRQPLLVNSREDFDRLLGFIFVEQPMIPGALRDYFAAQAVQNRSFNEKVWHDLMNPKVPLERYLPRITAQTLVVWGDRDRVLDVSGAQVVKSALPQAQVVILKDCGHVPMIERPEETGGHHLRFMESWREERGP